jgi:hypothetical protein
MPKTYRKMRGGFLDSITSGLSNAWASTKKATENAYGSAIGSTSTSTPYYTAPTPSYTAPPVTGAYGGRKRSRRRSSKRRSRRMSGGYSDNISLSELDANAAPISHIKTAQPHILVGGKRRTKKHRCHRHSKSCKH